MKIIIVQGMTCLGKTTLCKQLQNDIPNCGYFALDTYKEEMWDKFGFDSAKQREHQSNLAKQLFYSDIYTAIKNKSYDYILVDYTFVNKVWDELMENLKIWSIPAKTIYLKPTDLSEHKKYGKIEAETFLLDIRDMVQLIIIMEKVLIIPIIMKLKYIINYRLKAKF